MQTVQNSMKPKSGVSLRIWEIADQITRVNGRRAKRREVLSTAEVEGIHPGTASKQFNDWRLAYEGENRENREDRQTGFSEAPATTPHLQLEIKPDGRVLIPAELRVMMKLDSRGRVNAELVDGELRLFSPLVALERLRRYVSENDKGSGSAVDELIAERRAAAAKE